MPNSIMKYKKLDEKYQDIENCDEKLLTPGTKIVHKCLLTRKHTFLIFLHQ